MAKIFIVDGAGARVASLDQARTRFDDATIAAFGQDIDLHDHTPQNQIAGINALVWTEVGEELLRAALYGASIDHAPGKFLDAFGSLLDIQRDQATHTRVLATMTGVTGTVVEAGSLARTTHGDEFRSEATATIEGTGTQVNFVATKPGPIVCRAGDLTNIVSVRSGWEFVNNVDDGVEGRNTESDASYRANLKARTAHSSVGSLSALDSALRAAGATNIKIIENATDASDTIDGIVIPAHSIFVIADGGVYDDMVRSLENHRGMGVGTLAAIVGRPVNMTLAGTINNGILRFDGVDNVALNLSTQSSPASIANYLNTRGGNLPRFEAVGTSLMPFFNWKPGLNGFTEVSGNVSDAAPVRDRFEPIRTVVWTGGVVTGVMFFGEDVSIQGGTISGAALQYTSADGTETSLALSNFTLRERMLTFDIASPRMPAASVSVFNLHINFSAASSGKVVSANGIDITTSDILIEIITNNTANLGNVIAHNYAKPGGGGIIRLNAYCDTTTSITDWQYQRARTNPYQNIDNSFVSLVTQGGNLTTTTSYTWRFSNPQGAGEVSIDSGTNMDVWWTSADAAMASAVADGIVIRITDQDGNWRQGTISGANLNNTGFYDLPLISITNSSTPLTAASGSTYTITLFGAGSGSASDTITADIPIGYDRTLDNELHVRAVNSTGNGVISNEPVPVVSTAAPSVVSGIMDGSVFELTFNQDLLPFHITSTPSNSPFLLNVNGSNRADITVDRMMAYGNKLYVETNSGVFSDVAFTAAYAPSNLAANIRLQGSNTGLTTAAFTQSLTTLTPSNRPSRPTEVVAIRNGDDNTIDLRWVANDNRGGAIKNDLYEYSTSADNGNTWSVWTPYTPPETPPTPLTTTFVSNTATNVRIRASVPNIRVLQALGLDNVLALGPVLRSAGTALSMTITMDAESDLTGTALDDIRQSLIRRVNGYDIGETIWVKDLEAVIEAKPGTRVATLVVTIKSGSIAITSSYKPRAFQRWTLRSDDITITFNQ